MQYKFIYNKIITLDIAEKIFILKKTKYAKKHINIQCYEILEIFKFGEKEGTRK